MITADTIIYEKAGDDACLAVLDNGKLREFNLFNENGASEGNVYLGKIIKKINLSDNKVGFMINIGDTTEAFMSATERGLLEVNMTEGQSVVVQVNKQSYDTKGAKLVRAIQIAGTYIVYRPFGSYVDVSQKIEDSEIVAELSNAIKENLSEQTEGWVVRTCAKDADINDVIAEMTVLREVYESIRIKARNASAPALLYAKENPLFDLIRRYNDSLKTVIVNDHNLEEKVKSIFDKSVVYNNNPSEEFGIQDMLQDAMAKTVKLKSGGSIIIEETSACVAIDVNSSDISGNGRVDSLNIEAAKQIAHEIILRNLAGKIIIDFAGSTEYRFIRNVIDVLEEELRGDSQSARVLGLSKGGNVEIIRRRKNRSLLEQFSTKCPTCSGTGRVEL